MGFAVNHDGTLDMSTRTEIGATMAHHPPAPACTVCGHPGRIVEDDFGFTVICTNRHCPGVPALCDNEATLTRDAAWSLWRWKQEGVTR